MNTIINKNRILLLYKGSYSVLEKSIPDRCAVSADRIMCFFYHRNETPHSRRPYSSKVRLGENKLYNNIN